MGKLDPYTQNIARLIGQGYSHQEVVGELKLPVSAAMVGWFARRYDMKSSRKPGARSHYEPYLPEVQKRLAEGQWTFDIWRELKMPGNPNKFAEWLKARGLIEKSKRPSKLDPYRQQIEKLAADGATCPEIVERLELPSDAKYLNKKMRHWGIETATYPGCSSGERHWNWKGGVTIVHGYRYVRAPDHPHKNHHGYYQEHRLVMEQHLGRYLQPQEVVHHGPGGTLDNRIENLTLYASNAEHLAETLKGQVPNWTEQGRASLAASADRRRKKRQPDSAECTTRQASGSGAPE